MKNSRAALVAALFMIWSFSAAFAQDVTLTSHDGTVRVSGHLLGYDGAFYRIESIYGELTLDGSGVICTGPGCPDLENFVAEFSISGARTIGETLMPALVEGFAAENGYDARRILRSDTDFRYVISSDGNDLARIDFRVTSSDEGFADLLANEADIALSMREVRPEEVARGRDAGLGKLDAPGRSRVLALDGIVPVVSPSNPVRNISLSNIARIFTGEIQNWSELGGVDAPIYRHLRAPNSGLLQAFEDIVMAPGGKPLAAGVIRHASNAGLEDAVAADPFAIGITSYSSLGNARPVSLVGSCGFVVEPGDLSIKSEDYALIAPLLIYTPARRMPKLARDLMLYLRSPAAQVVIQRIGFVDQTIASVPIAQQGDRFANAITVAGDEVTLEELQKMTTLLRPLSRLTTTFRFRAGSSDLDAPSRANAEQLARSLEAGFFDGRELVFVGFSDGAGAADVNRRLARKRAFSVRDAVLRSAPTVKRERTTIRVEAFGEALPMACDDSSWGRQVNRRVEVWMK